MDEEEYEDAPASNATYTSPKLLILPESPPLANESQNFEPNIFTEFIGISINNQLDIFITHYRIQETSLPLLVNDNLIIILTDTKHPFDKLMLRRTTVHFSVHRGRHIIAVCGETEYLYG